MDLVSQIEEGHRNYRDAMKLLEECGIEECCVCLTSLSPMLPCRHFVCRECCVRLDKCPICRTLVYVVRDANDQVEGLETLTEAAGLTLSMSDEDLKKEISPRDGKIVVRLSRKCYCYDCRRVGPRLWVFTAKGNLTNADILQALLLHGLKRDPDCGHLFMRGCISIGRTRCGTSF